MDIFVFHNQSSLFILRAANLSFALITSTPTLCWAAYSIRSETPRSAPGPMRKDEDNEDVDDKDNENINDKDHNDVDDKDQNDLDGEDTELSSIW